jgi:hypothetical protein
MFIETSVMEELKMPRIILVILAIVLTLPTTAFSASKVRVTISTIPAPMTIEVNGVVVGETQTTSQEQAYHTIIIEQTAGIYRLRAISPGFQVYSKQYVVDTNPVFISVHPSPESGLLEVQSGYQVAWASLTNEMQYKTGLPGGKLSNYILNLDKKTVTPDAPLLGVLQDKIILQSIDTNQTAYLSPDNRFVLYTNKKTRNLQILNLRNQQNIVLFHDWGDEFIGHDVGWSKNNLSIWIYRDAFSYFQIYFDVDPVEVRTVSLFKSQIGEDIYVDRVFSRCSENRMCLVRAAKQGNIWSGWLVDARTQIGMQIPLKGVQTAIFTPFEDAIYVAAEDGIVRLSLDLKEKALISSVVSGKWWWRNVKFSNTLDYMFFEIGVSESPTYWIYKIPPYTPQS